MAEHVAYWTALAQSGTVVVFGPVADPNGVWGVAIVEAEDEAAVGALTSRDPVMRAEIGARYEVLPMPRAVIGKKRQ